MKDADISRLTEELSKCQSLPQEDRQVRFANIIGMVCLYHCIYRFP